MQPRTIDITFIKVWWLWSTGEHIVHQVGEVRDVYRCRHTTVIKVTTDTEGASPIDKRYPTERLTARWEASSDWHGTWQMD